MELMSVAGLVSAASAGFAVLRGAIPLLYRASGFGQNNGNNLSGDLNQSGYGRVPMFGRVKVFSSTTSGSSVSESYAANQTALSHAILLTGGWFLLAWFLLCLAEIVIGIIQRRKSPSAQSNTPEHQEKLRKMSTQTPVSYANIYEAGYAAHGISPSPLMLNLTLPIVLSTTQLAALGSTLAVLAGDLAVASRDGFLNAIKSAWSFKGIYLSGGALFIGTTFFLIKTELAVALYATFVVSTLQFVLQRFFFVLANLLIVIPWILVYPGVVLVLGVMKVFTVKNNVRIIIRANIPQLGSIVFNLVKVLMALLAAIYFWIANDPLSSMIPLDTSFGLLYSTAKDVWFTILEPSCVVLRWPLRGVFDTINHPSLVSFSTLAVNAITVFPRVLFFRPLATGELPQIVELDDYQTTLLQNGGDFLQNLTVNIVNIGIGNLKDYYPVNGTTPPLLTVPKDDPFQYVIRAFGARLWLAITTAVATVVGLLLTVLEIPLKVFEWFRPNGAYFWTFEYVRDKSHQVGYHLATIVDIAPSCEIPGAEFFVGPRDIKYGDIVSGIWSAVLAVVFILKDIIVGEIYAFVESFDLLAFSAGYFYAEGREIVEYSAGISRAARALGCAFGNFTEGLGITIDAVLRLLLNSIPLLLIKLVFYARLAFTQQVSDILEELDDSIQALADDLKDLPKLSWFVYRFANKDSAKCSKDLDAICGLGATLENGLDFIGLFIVIAVEAVSVTVQRIVNFITLRNEGKVKRLTFKPLVLSAYRVGASAAIFLATLIPISIECHKTQPNICAVRFYEQLDNIQTPTVCLATFASTVGGGILGGLVAIAGIAFEFVVNLDFIKGNNNGEILNSSNQVLLQVFQRVLAIFNLFLMGPVCPAGHFFDCPVSLFFPGATFCSKFFCYVNDAVITVTTQLGDIVIQAINLAFGIAKIILTGDFSTATIRGVLEAAWALFSAVLLQTVFFILRTFLGPLLSIIRTICDILIIKTCVEFLDSVLGTNQNSGFGPTRTRNYLDRNLFTRKRAEPLSIFPDITDEKIQNRVQFEIYKSFGFIYPHSYNETTQETVWRSRYVTDETLVMHLANYTKWDVGSSCERIIRANGKKHMSQIEEASQILIMNCIEDKVTMLALAAGVPTFSWLPDSLIYNARKKAPFVLAHVAVSAAMLFQFESDKRLPHEKVMSAEYRQFFADMGLSVTHLDTSFRQFYPEKTPGKVAVNASAIDLAEFEYYRANNVTPYMYWYNNYYNKQFLSEEDLKDAATRQNTNSTVLLNDRVAAGLQSLDDFFDTSIDMVLQGFQVQREHVEFVTHLDQVKRRAENIDPVNQLSLDDPCLHLPGALCVINGSTNTRYEIFKRHGPERMDDYDRRRISEGAFFTTAKALDALFSLGSKFVNVLTGETYYHDELDNANYLDAALINDYGRAYKSSTEIDVPLHDPRLDIPFKEHKKTAQKRMSLNPEGPQRSYDTREEWFESLSSDEKVKHLLNAKRVIREQKRAESKLRMAKMNQMAAQLSSEPIPTFSDFASAIHQGFSKRATQFLEDNDAVWPAHAVQYGNSSDPSSAIIVDRTAGDQAKARLSERSPLTLIVIASVSALSYKTNLNVTRVPIWCNATSDLRKICAFSDWKNAANYLKDDPVLYANFVGFLNSTLSYISDAFKPRTASAALFREKVGDIASSISAFAWESVARIRGFYDAENIDEIKIDVLNQFAESQQDQEYENYKKEKEAEFDKVTTFKRGIETHPQFSHLFQRTRKYVPISEQRRRSNLWFAENYGQYFSSETVPLVDHASTDPDMAAASKYRTRYDEKIEKLKQKTMGSNPMEVLQYFAERSLVDDPATMTMAIPLEGSQKQVVEAATRERSLFAASTRAYYSWIQEEQMILDDYDRIKSMLMTTDQRKRQVELTRKMAQFQANLESQAASMTGDLESDQARNRTIQLMQQAMAEEGALASIDVEEMDLDDSPLSGELSVKLGSIRIKSRYFRCKLYEANSEKLRSTYGASRNDIPGCTNPYDPLGNVPDVVKIQASSRAVLRQARNGDKQSSYGDVYLASAYRTHLMAKDRVARSITTDGVEVVASTMPVFVKHLVQPNKTMTYWNNLKKESQKKRMTTEELENVKFVKNFVQVSFGFADKTSDQRLQDHLMPSMQSYQQYGPVSDPFAQLGNNAERVSNAAYTSDGHRISTHFFYEPDELITDVNDTFQDIAQRAGQAGFPISVVCPFPNSFICDANYGCWQLAQLAVQIKRLVLAFIHIGTNWAPLQTVRSFSFFPYAYDITAPTRIGFGEYPPYFYARGISPWYLYRGLPGEIAGAQNGTDGPKWRTLFLDITGGRDIPALTTTGPLYSEYRLYRDWRNNNSIADDPANQGIYDEVIRNSEGWALIYFIQEGLGVQMLEFVDGFIAFLSDPDVVAASIVWVSDLFTCRYWEQLTCRKRLYSVMGAYTLIWDLFKWPIVFFFVIGSPMTALTVIFVFGSVVSIAVPVLAWGWSPICSLPPTCSVPEIFEILVYVVFPKADLFEGNFITNSDYGRSNAFLYDTALSRQVYPDAPPTGRPERTYGNCRNMGFQNEYDGYEAFEIYQQSRIFDPLAPKWTDGTANRKALPLWLQLLRSTTDTTYTIFQVAGLQSYFPRPKLTRDWKGEFTGAGENIYADYYATSDVHYRVQNQCAEISVYRSIGLLMLKSSVVIVLSATLVGILFVLSKGLLLLLYTLGLFLITAWLNIPRLNDLVSGGNFYLSQFDGKNLDKTPFAALWDSEAEQNLKSDMKLRGLI